MNKSIAQVVVGLPVDGPFDYSVPDKLIGNIQIGHRVKVMFNRSIRLGFVIGFIDQSQFKRLNPILEVIDNLPVISEKGLQLTRHMSEVFGCSLGECIEAYLPAQLRKKKGLDDVASESVYDKRPKKIVKTLVHDLYSEEFWEYLSAQLESTVRQGLSAVIMVPDVSQISFVYKKLQGSNLAPIGVLDGKLTQKKEYALWNQIKSGYFKIILGTRKAVFAPADQLGLIVILDEEHASYKQEQSPHYHVHDLALNRSAIEQASVMFVSAVPRTETWHMAKTDKWEVKYFKRDKISDMQLVDMNNYNPRKSSIISVPLKNCLDGALSLKKKSILFLNKKGFGQTTQCTQCGYTVRCKRCDMNMTFLSSRNIMICRSCGKEISLPKICPSCNGSYLRSTGMGLEKLQKEALRQFPTASVGYFDQDTKEFPKKADIVVATQALFQKRHTGHFDIIAIMDFDSMLYHMDYRVSYRAFSLLMGLRLLSGEKVIVQTRLISNECIKAAMDMDFEGFYIRDLQLRKELGYPPFKKMVTILVRGLNEKLVISSSQKIFEELKKNVTHDMEVLDPQPDITPKLRDQYRHAIFLKGSSIKNILSTAKGSIKAVRSGQNIVTINVD